MKSLFKNLFLILLAATLVVENFFARAAGMPIWLWLIIFFCAFAALVILVVDTALLLVRPPGVPPPGVSAAPSFPVVNRNAGLGSARMSGGSDG